MRIGGILFRMLVASSVMLAAALPASGAPPQLFAEAGGPPGAGALRHRFVRIDSGLLASGGDVTLNLFDDVVALSRGARVVGRANGLDSWSSAIEDDRFGYALFVSRDGSVHGQIEAGGAVFQVRPAGGPLHEIAEVDPAALPPEAEPLESGAGGSPAESVARFARSVQRGSVGPVRVLVVYTPAAAAASADIEAEAQLAVDAANISYENSDMLTRLELVATAETDYAENGDIYDDLAYLAGTADGEMDEVHALRNAYLADFVALLTEVSPDYCGLASLMSTVSSDFEDQAFSVTYRPCAVGNLTFAHEIGHNMGCQHDRANAASAPAYSWAYGYQDPEGDFRTVMAISTGCPSACPRIAHFANPNVLYLGDSTGVDAGESDAAACALAIDATSAVTSDFRMLVPPTLVEASTIHSDRVEVSFWHPWPWSFQVYRSSGGGPLEPLDVTPDSPFVDATAIPGTSYDYWVSTRSMVDGESSLVGPATGMRAVPTCGNSIHESPAEDCDDGNQESGDGCAPDCTLEVPLDAGQAACVFAINDRATRLSGAQGKENLYCLAGAAMGSEPDPDACLSADARSKIARIRAKVVSVDETLCATPPAFGYTGAVTASDAALDERRGFLLDLFGSDLSTAAIAKATDSDGAGCQKSIAKFADKLVGLEMSSFLACKKSQLAAGSVFAGAALEQCFDEVASQAEEAGTKIATAILRIAAARVKKCAATDLAVAFPGSCAAATGTAFDECVAASAACRTCRFFNFADGLSRDCDVFDNGAADSSCAF